MISYQQSVGLRLLTALLFLLTSAVAAETAPLTRYEFSEVAMGVRARIVLYSADEASAAAASRAAFDRIARLEDVMSDYRPTSELMRLCAKAGGPSVLVSSDLMLILRKSQELSRHSDGAFDATVGPLAKLWRVARKSGKLPDPAEIARAKALVGWRKVTLNRPKGTVTLAIAGMQLDLGGIAKGYACDEALRALKRLGVGSALVEMGGDIAISGPPPGKAGWDIAIENATDPEHKTMILANTGVSSSGDVEQYVEIDGKRYSHILDPSTGLGLTERIAVTVLAPDATTSDGLSTAISVLGKDKGLALAKTYRGVTAYVRVATDN